jgi:hypothetical protein
MPYTVNGFGTTIYHGRGDVGWGGADSVVWVVALYAPLIPVSCVHTFDWHGNQYRSVPLRWSVVLVLRSFLAAWRSVFLFLAIIAFIIALIGLFSGMNKGDQFGLVFFGIALGITVGLVAAAGILHLWLSVTDQRTCDIRRVLGVHSLGTSDPALWARAPDANPTEVCGTDTFAEAVDALLERREFSQAMWAARFATVIEDATTGERLTDDILNHPDVIEAIAEVRRDPKRWREVMMSRESP